MIFHDRQGYAFDFDTFVSARHAPPLFLTLIHG